MTKKGNVLKVSEFTVQSTNRPVSSVLASVRTVLFQTYLDMVKGIKIILYNQVDHYFPGSEVSGAVVVTTDKPKEYSSIVVKLFGRADVHWTEERGSGEDRTTESFTNQDTYIKQRLVLWSRETAPLGELPIGEHTFPFQYQLPEDIPRSFESSPTFEGSRGKIRYEIRAKIVQDHLLKINHRASTFLAVREQLDLRGLCMEPQTFDKASQVNCLCFNFGSMNMMCNMPCTGFSPGDTIPISVHIENLTTKNIRVRAVLQRQEVYTSYSGRTNRPIIQCSVTTSPQIRAGEITSFEGRSLQIHPEVSETLRSCSCISVEYAVVVTAIVPLALNVSMMIPIVIQQSS